MYIIYELIQFTIKNVQIYLTELRSKSFAVCSNLSLHTHLN